MKTMQQIQASYSDPFDRFPDCVRMEINSVSSQETPKNLNEVELLLTIRFGTQEIKLPNGGLFVFGLKRGALKLNLSKGQMPLGKIRLTAKFQTEISVEEQYQEGRGREIGLSKEPGLKMTGSISFTDKVQYKIYQVKDKGTATEPYWVFTSQLEDYLTGTLGNEHPGTPLGTVELKGPSCEVVASFVVSQQTDIYLVESAEALQGWFPMNALSLHKQRSIRREFFLRCIAPQLQNPLSYVELQLP
jgi:hypothetical protein